MSRKKRFSVKLDENELELLKEALDSHEYWQLSDPADRDSGYVMIDDDDPRLPADIAACRALAQKLHELSS